MVDMNRASRCLICGKPNSNTIAKVCRTCDNGNCVLCGSYYVAAAGRICGDHPSDKCVRCGNRIGTAVARLCLGCKSGQNPKVSIQRITRNVA